MHWAAKYIGMRYIEGENDCASFAERVQHEIFHRAVRLPQHRAQGVRGWSQQIETQKDAVATRTEDPQEGDAVLMIGRGRLDHIGVYTLVNGTPYVLHAMKNAGQVCLHRLRDLAAVELKVEGFYKWIT